MQDAQPYTEREQYSNNIKFTPIANVQLSPLIKRKPVRSSGSSDLLQHEKDHSSIGDQQLPKHWSTNPAKLKKPLRHWLPSLLGHILLTLLPIFFLVIGIAALVLDGKPTSRTGHNIIRATTIGPTLFPIIFAGLVGRLMRSISLWKAQNGGKLGFLEQLNGSQSLAGALERAWCLRRYGIISLAILTIWTLSPLGGQSALRILSTTPMDVRNTQQLHYLNSSGYGNGFDGASTRAYDASLINSLYVSSLLSPLSIQQASMDSWGNIKIPTLDSFVHSRVLSQEVENGTLITLNQSQSIEYSSLIGTLVVGIPDHGTANFTMQTSYFQLSCGDIEHAVTENETLPLLGPTQIHNSSTILSTMLEFTLDTNTLLPDDKESVPSTNPDILFISWNTNHGSGYEGYYFTSCDLRQPTVESHVVCLDGSCNVVAMRQLDPGVDTYFNYETYPIAPGFNASTYPTFSAFLESLPLATGNMHAGTSTPTEHYLVGDAQVFNQGDAVVLNGTDPITFSYRLTRLFNTYWQAGLAPSYTAGNYPTDQSKYLNSTTAPFPVNVATASLSHTRTVYQAHRVWVALLLLTTLILQICAVPGLVLKYMYCTVPDILGFVSTMTRDNPFVPLPEGGNTLDGLERARELFDLRVQLADVRWEGDVGHLAFRAVGGGGGGGGMGHNGGGRNLEEGRVEKDRYYI